MRSVRSGCGGGRHSGNATCVRSVPYKRQWKRHSRRSFSHFLGRFGGVGHPFGTPSSLVRRCAGNRGIRHAVCSTTPPVWRPPPRPAHKRGRVAGCGRRGPATPRRDQPDGGTQGPGRCPCLEERIRTARARREAAAPGRKQLRGDAMRASQNGPALPSGFQRVFPAGPAGPAAPLARTRQPNHRSKTRGQPSSPLRPRPDGNGPVPASPRARPIPVPRLR
jgi:hypothetical protein